ncbi:MAG TPA: energy transducer TonB [Clostridia bacterium]|nr:energy transducer TonB [Clostridia bacterium]
MNSDHPFSQASNPEDELSRLRESVSTYLEASPEPKARVPITIWTLIFICAIGVAATGYLLVRRMDVKALVQTVGKMSGTFNSASAEEQDEQKAEKKDVPTRHKSRGRAPSQRTQPAALAASYNVEIVDGHALSETPFVASAMDSSGRKIPLKPSQVPAIIIPHALPDAPLRFGYASPSAPHPQVVKSLSLDEYRNLRGAVVLEATIGTNGAAEELAILRGPAELFEPAIKIVKSQRYDPPVRRNASRVTTLTVTFSPETD